MNNININVIVEICNYTWQLWARGPHISNRTQSTRTLRVTCTTVENKCKKKRSRHIFAATMFIRLSKFWARPVRSSKSYNTCNLTVHKMCTSSHLHCPRATRLHTLPPLLHTHSPPPLPPHRTKTPSLIPVLRCGRRKWSFWRQGRSSSKRRPSALWYWRKGRALAKRR